MQLALGRFSERLGWALATNQLRPEDAPTLCLQDLYLVTAILDGDRAALEIFERTVLPAAAEAARGVVPASSLDEVRQLLRLRLFSPGAESTSELAAYSGRGSLKTWLRVVALRLALNQRRDREREELRPNDGLPELPGEDLELAVLKARHRGDFQAAFAEAIASLTPRDRNLLRLRFLENKPIELIADHYGVHRVSCARWLGRVRDAVFERTRAALRRRFSLGDSEVESLIRWASSQLEVSLGHALGRRLETQPDER